MSRSSFFKSPFFYFLYIVFLMLLVSGISYFYLLPESLRLDESQSIWQANRSFGALLEISARDVHMPLYNILLNNWIKVFGNNIFTNRILSLLFFILSIPSAFILTKFVTKKSSVGVYMATLFALSPFMNWFGSELRMYSMMVFFTIWGHYFFLKIFESRRQSSWFWLGYFAASLFGIYSHYFYILFILCQCIFFVCNQKHFAKGFKLNFLFLLIMLAAGVSPWILYVKYINTVGSQAPLLARPSTIDLFNVYSNHFFGFQVDSINSLILAMWPMFGILFLYFLQKRQVNLGKFVPTHINFLKEYSNKISTPFLAKPPTTDMLNSIVRSFPVRYFYLAIMAFAPTFLLFLLSITLRPVFLSRYLIMCLVPLFALLSSLLYSYKSKVLDFVKVLFVILMCTGLAVQTVSAETSVKENYRETINYIIANSNESDIVLISPPFTIYPFKYYYNGSAKLVTIPEWDLSTGIPAFTQANLDAQLSDAAAKYKRVFLVLSYDQGYEKNIKDSSDSRFSLTSSRTFSPKLNLYVYNIAK
jgi:mannosyltransferase